jgi:hypothetical protein
MKKTKCFPNSVTPTYPCAWIVDPSDKGRKKIYPGNKIYFEDGSEFMIELFNPLQDSVLTELKINGKLASATGLILRPGERFYLDCFIDEKKKFMYKTYEVESGSGAVQKAIANNGNIEINFYREKIKPKPIQPLDLRTYTSPGVYTMEYDNSIGYGEYLAQNISGTVDYSAYSNMSNTAGLGNIVSPQPEYSRSNSLKGKALNKWSPITTHGAQGPQGTQGTQGPRGFAGTPVLEETGRVEKGEVSNQQFVSIDMDFELYTMNTVFFQILPESKKPITTAEIKSGINFCPNCGHSIISGDRFCRNCGHKLY